jgi:hypothetical protein
MFTTHITTLTARVAVVLTFAAALVLAVVAGFNAVWTGIFANITGEVFASNAVELLIGSAAFLVISGLARAVQWVTEQTFDIDLSEVEVPEVRFALNEAVTA